MRRLALAILLVASPAVAQDDPVATVNAFLAAPSGPFVVTAKADAVAPDGTGVRIDGLTLGFALPRPGEAPERWTLAAPTVLVDGLDRTADGWRADAIRAPSATLTPGDGAAEQRFDALELVAPSWPTPATTPAAGPVAALEPPLRFLAGMSAERASVAAPGWSARVGAVSEGRFAEVEIATPSAGTIAIANLDVAVIADALFADGGAPRPALGRFAATDLASPADGSRIEALTLEGVSLAPQSPPLASRIDDYLATQAAAPPPPAEPDSPPPPPTPEEVDLGLAVWNAVAVDRFSLDGFSETRPDGETVAFASVSAANVGAGRAADLRLTGLRSTTVDGASVAIGEIAVLGLRAPDDRALRAVVLDPDTPPTADIVVGLLPMLSRAAVSGVKVESPEGVSVTVDEGAVATSGHIGRIPTLIEFVGRGAVDLPKTLAGRTPEEQFALEALAARGVSRIAVDAGSRIAWGNDRIDYASHLDAPGLGRYRESYAISGIPRWLFDEPGRALEIVAFLSLDRARFEVADEGALALMRSVMDREAPGTFDRETATAIAELDATLAPALGEANAAIVRNALTGFLGGGRTMALEAAPARPVPLTQIGAAAIAPRALVDLLKLTLTVTP